MQCNKYSRMIQRSNLCFASDAVRYILYCKILTFYSIYTFFTYSLRDDTKQLDSFLFKCLNRKSFVRIFCSFSSYVNRSTYIHCTISSHMHQCTEDNACISDFASILAAVLSLSDRQKRHYINLFSDAIRAGNTNGIILFGHVRGCRS